MNLGISNATIESIGRAVAQNGPKSGHYGHDNFLLNEGTIVRYKDILSKVFKDNQLENCAGLELSGKKLTLTLQNLKNETFRFIITVGKNKTGKESKDFTKIEYGGGNLNPFERIIHGNLWAYEIAEYLNRFLGRVSS